MQSTLSGIWTHVTVSSTPQAPPVYVCVYVSVQIYMCVRVYVYV